MLAAQEALVECACPPASRPCFLSWHRVMATCSKRGAQQCGLAGLPLRVFWLWADFGSAVVQVLLCAGAFCPERKLP